MFITHLLLPLVEVKVFLALFQKKAIFVLTSDESLKFHTVLRAKLELSVM